jgi:hypothetical protein
VALLPFPTVLVPADLNRRHASPFAMKQSWISFWIVWCQFHSCAPLRCRVLRTFLFGMTREYPSFPGLYCSLMWIYLLLSRLSVPLWDVYFILSRSLQDISAIWPMSNFLEWRLFHTWLWFWTLL